MFFLFFKKLKILDIRSMFVKFRQNFSLFLFLFFSAQRTNDLNRKQEKVGPFECDVLEKQSRVSARCYPLTVHILHNDKRKRTQKTPFCPSCTRPSVMLSGRIMLCLVSSFLFSVSSLWGRWMHPPARSRRPEGVHREKLCPSLFNQIFAEKSQISSKNENEKWNFIFIPAKFGRFLCWNFEIWAVHKYI